jgi:hypothetical protein
MEHLSGRLNLRDQKLLQLDESRRLLVEIRAPHSDNTMAQPWTRQPVLDVLESGRVSLPNFNFF